MKPGLLERLGQPGEYPFTRGVQPTMYRARFWTMRQYAGFGTAEESNRRYKFLLASGQTGLSVAFDLPTQMGYDSDASVAHGEVGKVGVAIDSLADMETIFEGIPLDKVSTSFTINGTATILLAMYQAVAADSPSRSGVAAIHSTRAWATPRGRCRAGGKPPCTSPPAHRGEVPSPCPSSGRSRR